MTELILNFPREQTVELVEEALERTEGINSTVVSDHQVVGKTGVGFPRVLWSYGEKLYVDISETDSENRTKITIRGEKNVAINIGANPEKFKRRFVDELNALRKVEEDEASISENTTELKKQNTDIIYCPHCGAENPTGSSYCGGCGGEMPMDA